MQGCNSVGMYVNALEPHSMFFVKDIQQEILPSKSFMSICKALSRLEKEKKIERVAKGIYCKPKMSAFGLGRIPFSERNIINFFLGSNQLAGVLAGYSLFRKYGLTTQMESNFILYSNRTDAEVRSIRNVTIYRLRGDMNEGVKECLEFLLILDSLREIEDFNYAAFVDYLEEKVKKLPAHLIEEAFKLRSFSKRTIAQAKVILDHFEVENGLGHYLSPASVYKILSMEEIYAFAREQRAFS